MLRPSIRSTNCDVRATMDGLLCDSICSHNNFERNFYQKTKEEGEEENKKEHWSGLFSK